MYLFTYAYAFTSGVGISQRQTKLLSSLFFLNSYVHSYVYPHVHIYMHLCTYTHIYTHIFTCMNTFSKGLTIRPFWCCQCVPYSLHFNIYAYVYTYIYICIYIYMYVCTYIFANTLFTGVGICECWSCHSVPYPLHFRHSLRRFSPSAGFFCKIRCYCFSHSFLIYIHLFIYLYRDIHVWFTWFCYTCIHVQWKRVDLCVLVYVLSCLVPFRRVFICIYPWIYVSANRIHCVCMSFFINFWMCMDMHALVLSCSHIYKYMHVHIYIYIYLCIYIDMGWLRLVGSLKL